jgi:hypothetical protein
MPPGTTGPTSANDPTATAPSCGNYFSCYAGATSATSVNPGGAGAAIDVTGAAASSKLPCYPMPSGLCDVTSLPALGNAPTPVGGVAALATYETKSTAPSSKKYQYWSVKVILNSEQNLR